MLPPLEGPPLTLPTTQLITQSAEWRSNDARLALAASCDDAGMADLLRNRNLAKMRKPYALQICRSWGYKCDVWVLRNGARKSERPASAEDAAAAADSKRPRHLPLATRSQIRAQPPPLPSLESLQYLLSTCLRPAALRAARNMSGLGLEAACRKVNSPMARAGHQYKIENRRRDIQEVLHVMKALTANAGVQRLQARELLAEAAVGTGEDEPAYRRMQLFEGPTRLALQSLHRVVSAAEADMRLKAKDEVWPEWRAEFEAALVDCYAFIAHAHAAVAPFWVAGSRTYLQASNLIMELVEAFFQECVHAYAHRIHWMGEVFPVASASSGDSAASVDLFDPGMPYLMREFIANPIVRPAGGDGSVEQGGGREAGGDLAETCAWLEEEDTAIESGA